MTTQQHTPKPRRDGKCYVCRKPYHIEPRQGVDPAAYVDPFCSAVCARIYFGTVSQTDKLKKVKT